MATKEQLELAEQLAELLKQLNGLKSEGKKLDEEALGTLADLTAEQRNQIAAQKSIEEAAQAVFDLQRETILTTGQVASKFEQAATALEAASRASTVDSVYHGTVPLGRVDPHGGPNTKAEAGDAIPATGATT